jgi:hypothetical protein
MLLLNGLSSVLIIASSGKHSMSEQVPSRKSNAEPVFVMRYSRHYSSQPALCLHQFVTENTLPQLHAKFNASLTATSSVLLVCSMWLT